MLLETCRHEKTFPRRFSLLSRKAFPMSLHWKDLLYFALIVAAYFVSGKGGLELAETHPNVSVLWPPTGIAFATLLILGIRAWPAIFVGALLVNITIGTPETALATAVGNTLEAVVGTHLANRFANGKNAFLVPRNVFAFVLISFFSTAISALIGAGALSVSGLASWMEFPKILLVWWQGDVLAALILTPFLVLLAGRPHHALGLQELIEISILLVALNLVCVCVFGPPAHSWAANGNLIFLCIPFALWMAFKYCPLEAAGANLILCGFAVWGSLHGYSPFASADPPLLLGAFVAVIATMTLAVAAYVMERREAEENLTMLAGLLKDANAQSAQAIAALQAELQSQGPPPVVEDRESELIKTANGLPHVFWILDTAKRKFVYVSSSYENVWGRSCQSLYDDVYSWFAGIHPEDQGTALRFFRFLLCPPGRDVFEAEYRLRGPGSTLMWVHHMGIITRNEAGEPVQAIGVATSLSNARPSPARAPRRSLSEAMLLCAGLGLGRDDHRGQRGL
jgi:integral membrane sensor domain MASE1